MANGAKLDGERIFNIESAEVMTDVTVWKTCRVEAAVVVKINGDPISDRRLESVN